LRGRPDTRRLRLAGRRKPRGRSGPVRRARRGGRGDAALAGAGAPRPRLRDLLAGRRAGRAWAHRQRRGAGHRVLPAHPLGGRPIGVGLVWSAASAVDRGYSVFVHLVDAGGALAAQHDGEPLDGRYPTWAWQTGAAFRDVHTIPTGALAPGNYRLVAGLYEPA